MIMGLLVDFFSTGLLGDAFSWLTGLERKPDCDRECNKNDVVNELDNNTITFKFICIKCDSVRTITSNKVKPYYVRMTHVGDGIYNKLPQGELTCFCPECNSLMKLYEVVE